MWASLRAAVHSMIRNSRKNGTAYITGSCSNGGSTSENVFARSTTTPPSTSLAGAPLAEAEHLTAPRRPNVQVDVVDDRVVPIDHQAGPVGPLIRQPFRLTVAPERLALRGEVAPAGLDSLRYELAGLHPAEPECRVLWTGDEIAPDER